MNLIANQAKYGQIKAFNFNILTWIEKMTWKKENLLLQNNLYPYDFNIKKRK